MLLAQFETSKGIIKIEIGKNRYSIIDNSERKIVLSIGIVNIIDDKDIIKTLYIGDIGELFYRNKTIQESKRLKEELYHNEQWEKILTKEIEKGNIWVDISLDDGYYGNPEYKLELIE